MWLRVQREMIKVNGKKINHRATEKRGHSWTPVYNDHVISMPL